MNGRCLFPYREYKDSGHAWIGMVPSQWEVLPNRALFRERIDKGHEHEQMLSVTINCGVIRQTELLENSSKKDSSNEDKSNYKLVLPGDITYNKMRAWQGAVGASSFRGIVSPAYVVQTLRRNDNPDYFHYLFRTPAFATEAERWSYGITSDQWSLRSGDFKQIYCPLPSRSEQDTIVRFLRKREHKINRLIRTKRRVIELLNEQKQAVIHHAVTRGLAANPALKPSGNASLGEVPSHWRVSRLGQFITLQRGFDITKEQQRKGNIPVISSGGVSSFHDEPSCKGPGVIVGRKGSVGSVWFIDKDYWAHDTTLWVQAFNGNCPRFIFYLLQIMNLKRFDTGSSNPTLNRNIVHPEPVAVPSPSEQEEIVTWLDQTLASLDHRIDNSDSQIASLREYRTRLIADVVTGKLDVLGVESLETEIEEALEPVNKTENEEMEESEELVSSGENNE